MFSLCSVPGDIVMFFPMAALIGALIGLGMLASNSELVVMQAAGMSRAEYRQFSDEIGIADDAAGDGCRGVGRACFGKVCP